MVSYVYGSGWSVMVSIKTVRYYGQLMDSHVQLWLVMVLVDVQGWYGQLWQSDNAEQASSQAAEYRLIVLIIFKDVTIAKY